MKIICPVCKEDLQKQERNYKCIHNHSFDIAKEGYVNLFLRKSENSGDEKEMIHARTLFLNTGSYDFLREEINKLIEEFQTVDFVDLACGEGYYTRYFNAPNKVGIDLSKAGLKTASKADKDTTYIISSIFDTPLASGSIDTVLTCFAPVAKEEIVRLLKDKGHFILIHPNVRHLHELREAVYDTPYDNEVEKIEIGNLNLIREYSISDSGTLTNEELIALFKMTPYYHTTSDRDKEKLQSVKELTVTFDFIISVYEK